MDQATPHSISTALNAERIEREEADYRRLLALWKLPFSRDCISRFLDVHEQRQRQEMIEWGFDGVQLMPFDSPLEFAFAVSWSMFRSSLLTDYQGRRRFFLSPQVEDGRYRVDFQVCPYGPGSGPYMSVDTTRCVGFPKIAVELDGHEFHEKTREQVTARNARDRHLQDAGWTVLRFSGSEFYGDPFACVEQVWVYALKQAEACDKAVCDAAEEAQLRAWRESERVGD